MPRPKNDKAATPTRLYNETIRIARTLASWREMSMAEYMHELVMEAARRDGPKLTSGFQALVEPEAEVKPGKPKK